MAHWFTVYCARPVRGVTVAALRAVLVHIDWHIAAETFGIDDDAVVESAVAHLAVTAARGSPGERFVVRYQPVGKRTLTVHVWTTKKRVAAEVAEIVENDLIDHCGTKAKAVRERLAGTIEVAAVELGLSQLEDMGLVIAGRVAEYLAEVGGGLIRDPSEAWWEMRKGVPKELFGPA